MKLSPGCPAPLLRLSVAHEGRHAAGELSPVRVQPAAPAGGEPGEQPGVPFARPVTGTLLLARMALARPLQLDVADKVTAERGPPGFLNVEEHYNIIPLDVEIYSAIKVVVGGEIKARQRIEPKTPSSELYGSPAPAPFMRSPRARLPSLEDNDARWSTMAIGRRADVL